MKSTQDEKIAKMQFASVYPHYLNKVEKKGRTKEELWQVIGWLTGYDNSDIQRQIDNKVSFVEFFDNAKLHPNASLIT